MATAERVKVVSGAQACVSFTLSVQKVKSPIQFGSQGCSRVEIGPDSSGLVLQKDVIAQGLGHISQHTSVEKRKELSVFSDDDVIENLDAD